MQTSGLVFRNLILVILARVRSLVVEELEQVVETNGEDGSENRSDPVDPVVVGERLSNNAGTKRSGRVNTGSSGPDSDKMSNEERHSDGEGSHEGSSVLLNSEEENGQTELSSAEHLNPETSSSGDAITKGVDERDGAGGKSISDTSSGHTGEELGNGEAESSDGRHSADEGKSEGDTRVELTSGNSEEDEDVDEEREAETERDHDDLGGVGASDGLVVVGNSGDEVGEQKEHESTNKLTDAGDGEVSEVLAHAERLGPSVSLIRGDVSSGGNGIHGLSGLSSGHRREVVHGFLGHCIFVMRLYEGLESQAGG